MPIENVADWEKYRRRETKVLLESFVCGVPLPSPQRTSVLKIGRVLYLASFYLLIQKRG